MDANPRNHPDDDDEDQVEASTSMLPERDLSSIIHGDADERAEAVARQTMVVNLNSPPPSTLSLPHGKSSMVPIPGSRKVVTLIAPAAPAGWDASQHDDRYLMDFRGIAVSPLIPRLPILIFYSATVVPPTVIGAHILLRVR